MKTEVMFHCGNAPKLERVIELTIALAARDEATAKVHLRNDLVWTEVGAGKTTDFASLGVTLTEKPAALKIKIENSLNHGNGAMCEGLLTINHSFFAASCSL